MKNVPSHDREKSASKADALYPAAVTGWQDVARAHVSLPVHMHRKRALRYTY
jgi:hypothetical protein